jgi:hypothetical protein
MGWSRAAEVPVIAGLSKHDDEYTLGSGVTHEQACANLAFACAAREDIPALLSALDALRRERDEARAALDKLPRTADGVPIVPGMTLYLECPDPAWWRLEPGSIVSVVADSITVGKGFDEYKGTHTICGEDVECGNLDCYSTLDAARAALAASAPAAGSCWCETCRPNTLTGSRMIVCPVCGNKRCPRATHHDNACTGSNEPGQRGSSWEGVAPAAGSNQGGER